MKLYRSLANGLLEAHPDDAAGLVDSMSEEEARSVVAGASAGAASETLRRMVPQRAATVLAGLDADHRNAIVDAMGLDLAVNLIRRMSPEARDALVESLPPEEARAAGKLLRFPAGTAGALMDPLVPALPGDLTARAAQEQIRRAPEHVRYNLYVVDREQVLIGVINLRELLLARPKDLLRSIANPNVLSILAEADRHAILTHPAWRDARSLPVVDEEGVYLGAVRYRTLRQLEEEMHAREAEPGASTVEALGDLFSTGIASVLGALASSVANPLPGESKRDQ